MSQNIRDWLSRLPHEAYLLLHDVPLLVNIALQLIFIGGTLAVLRLFGERLRTLLEVRTASLSGPAVPLVAAIVRISPWAALAIAFWTERLGFGEAGQATSLLHLAESLALAWVVIRLASNLVRNPATARTISTAAWIFAAIDILGLLEPIMKVLDSMSIALGDFRLTVLLVIRGVLTLGVLIWAANMASRMVEYRLHALPALAPAMQALASTLSRAVLLSAAVMIGLNSIGIDLTAFAVFSGAIGVGIGFGLQKIMSNLISGVILLIDRSIKPGDVIDLGGTTGQISRLSARFVSVTTRDGIEHLIPNEDLVTHRVTNLTYNNTRVRLHVRANVAYDSDLREAMRLCVEATKGVPRILETPVASCIIRNFGDSAIELEVRFWIGDPVNGTGSVKGAVMLGIWDRFRANGIHMPNPQRDIHIPEMAELADTIAKSLRLHGQMQRDAQVPARADFVDTIADALRTQGQTVNQDTGALRAIL
jgi:small-conductance mechanosensitive channel